MELKDVKWSYSGMKDYINCPHQYHEVKILKKYQKAPTQQMLYGTEVHEALELYVKEGKPLAKNYERFKDQVDSLNAITGDKYPEFEMALTVDRKKTEFSAPDYWVRGITDLLIVDGEQAYIVDYKTGSAKYPDPKQLQLMSLMVFEYFPQVNHVKAGLLFVMHNTFIPSEYKREDLETLWKDFLPVIERIRLSHEKDNWWPNPTPLCGWCPVTTCTHYRVKK